MRKIVTISLFIAIFFISCSKDKPDDVGSASSYVDKSDKEAVPVFTQKAVEEPFFTSINSSGIIEGIREADIISETSGLITEVFFEIGDYVNEGDVLLKVEDRMAGISYESAKQDYESSRIEFEALEKSFKTGGSSQLIFSQGKARLESARLRMEQARDTFDNTSIKAPFDGYISLRDISISVGSYIQPSVAVTHIVDTSSFRIRLTLGEDEIPLIQKGDDAQIILNSLPDLKIKASVEAVSPGSSQAGGGFPVLLSWKNELNGSVKSGMSAVVRILPDNMGKNEMIVPASAIVRRNGLDYVFRVKDDTAEAVEIRLAQSLGDRASILEAPGSESNIEAGDILVVTGLNTLAPGDPIIPNSLEDSL